MNQIYRVIETTRSYFQSDAEKALTVKIAQNSRERVAAQKLRKEVFAAELPAGCLALAELDEDEFDDHCRHLIVIDESKNKVVGTYRVLSAASARDLGRYYSESSFDLSKLSGIRGSLLELGRSCVHPDYRDGTVIRLLWAGLGEILKTSPERFVIGCPSVSLADGGHYAAAIHRKLVRKHLSEPELQVRPHDRLPFETLFANCDPVIPPLFKGYLRVGAQLMGAPHRDLKFGTVDFFMMLPVASIADRYSKRFISRAERALHTEPLPA
jgi:putative hemolysin